MKYLGIMAVLLVATSAFSDDNVTDLNTITTKLPSSSTTSREDIDQEITNARLRASTGAKSLLSVQSMFTYNGGSVQDPFGQQRPQLSPGTVENDPSKLTGQVSMKYRMSDHDNLNVGVGLGWLTPSYSGQRGQIEDPYVAYGRVFKAGDVQNVLNVQLMKYTADSSVANGLNYETDIDHTFLVYAGKTKLQLGVDIAWTHEVYSQQISSSGVEDELAAFPFSEYELTDKLSLRTVYRGLTYYNTLGATSTFQRDDATQSLGIGIAIARDMYFYPNIQWVWADIRPEKTNVALTANINM